MRDSVWQKSSYSGASNECVEVRTAGSLIELRESDEAHLTLRTTSSAFAAILDSAKASELDHHA